MVGNVKDIVRLSASAREALEGLVYKGKVAAAKRTRAPMLRKADAHAAGPAWTDEHMAAALDVSVATIHRTRQADVTQGLAGALERQRPIGRPWRTLDGAQEARLVAGAWSPPREGHARWTLRLRAERLVTREIVEAIGKATVRRTLKKMPASRGCKHNGGGRRRATPTLSARWQRCWRCPPGRTMPGAPWCAWTRRARSGWPMGRHRSPGRQGTRPVRMTRTNAGAPRPVHGVRPLAGPRHVTVTAQRPNADWAVVLREVADRQ